MKSLCQAEFETTLQAAYCSSGMHSFNTIADTTESFMKLQWKNVLNGKACKEGHRFSAVLQTYYYL